MRVLASCSAVLFFALGSAACSPPESPGEVAASESELRIHKYLATGDSVPFGYSPLVDPRDARNFVGFPEQVAIDAELRHSISTACPGETSGSFLSAAAPDNGCRAFKANFPLHDGMYTTTQIDRDLSYLRMHPRTNLITIMIGANDLFLLQRVCSTDPNPIQCINNGLPAALGLVAANLSRILQQFRDARFGGELIAVLYYSTNYNDPLTTEAVAALNQVVGGVAAQFSGRTADGFSAFFNASAAFNHDPCAAGLLIALPAGGCDVHPSPAGRDLLATAVESVLR